MFFWHNIAFLSHGHVRCAETLLAAFSPPADVKIVICGLKGRSPVEHGRSVKDSTRLKQTTVHPREMS
jgi:hypothetical protein